MRVAIVAETFLPEVNGVTNSVLRVLEHLDRRGHEALVVAPGPGPTRATGAPVVRVPAVRLPLYRSLHVGVPLPTVHRALTRFRPDVVHLAAPAVLGAAGAVSAQRLGVPAVAIYQTDLAGFARRYRAGAMAPALWWWLRSVHRRADLTLAPSTMACWELQRRGIGPVARWRRGVDTDRFHPSRRDGELRRLLAPNGEVLIGYAGRLAPEKRVHLLAHLADLPGCRLVVIGDGPCRADLQRRLPSAAFLGFLDGVDLPRAVASLDVFVHPGADETFCQAIQEAMAAGVPVVAPACGGPVDLVAHGRTGWLFPPDDPGILRGAVAELAASPTLRTSMSRRARAAVADRTWERVGDELLAHYRAVTDLDHTVRKIA